MDIEKKADFTQIEYFPGTNGNPFDSFLHKLVRLEKMPAVVFATLLLVIAFGAALLNGTRALGLWAFFLADWALLVELPKANKSFGPAKPSVLILALARSLVALLPFPIWLTALLELVGTLLVIYGFWIEPHRLTLTRQTVSTQKLPHGTRLRVLHLGDLHVERITAREQQLNQWVKELKPDLILFSGDFINLSYLHDPAAWKDARSILAEWKAPLGTFVVMGSPAVDLPEVIPGLVEDMPVHWLQDEKVTIPVGDAAIDIVGLTCTHKPFLDGPALERVAGTALTNFTVLLYHTPDLAPEAARRGLDLQLSGHTHGGQVRLPFYGALFAGSLYGKRFESGRKKLGDMTLYVTRGIGMEGMAAPRVRFLCPPEIILWEIEGQ